MKTTPSYLKTRDIDRDPLWFMVILTLVVIAMYVTTLIYNPIVRQPVRLIPFTILMGLHLFLHWRLEALTKKTNLIPWYVIGQGAITFSVVLLSEAMIMPVALFMGLIGEAVGLLGLTRWGFLSVLYYVILGTVNMILLTDLASITGWLVGMIPMLLFVVIYVTMYQRQMEAREQAQILANKLEEANQQLGEYAVRVEDLTIMAERQRMARDLHDTLSQGLAGLILQLEAIDAHLENKNPNKAKEIVALSMEQARVTLKEARYTIGDLRGETRVDMPIKAALQAEIQRFEQLNGISCDFDYEGTADLPKEIRETMLRITSEGLANINKHAQAKNVLVRVHVQTDSVHLTIKDDGKGFDLNSVHTGRYGLIGMRERAKLAGGDFEISSKIGKGTEINVSLPLEVENESN